MTKDVMVAIVILFVSVLSTGVTADLNLKGREASFIGMSCVSILYLFLGYPDGKFSKGRNEKS